MFKIFKLGTVGAVVLEGPCCKNLTAMESLDLERLEGNWYPVWMDLTDPKA